MNELLLVVLSLSASGALLALTLGAMKPLFTHLNRTWQYYIWLLVIARLLIPWSPAVNVVGGLCQEAEGYWAGQTIVTEEAAAAAGQAAEARAPKAAAAPWLEDLVQAHGWGVLWLGVAAGLLGRKIIGYRRFVNAIKRSAQPVANEAVLEVLAAVQAELGLRHKAAVGITPLVKAPLLLGVRRPLIVLPTEAMSKTDLTNTFRHELIHDKRGDIFYKWLAEFTLCLHWFDPVVYWVRRQIDRDCELACDEAVIARLTPAERKGYGQTLLDAVSLASAGTVHSVPVALGADGRLLKERLQAIRTYRPPSRGTTGLMVTLTPLLFCGMLFAGAYTLPAPEQTAAPQLSGEDAVVYEAVTLRRYEGEDGHRYIHHITANKTDRDIVGLKRGMLAFDAEGEPLAIDWFSLDSAADNAYFYLYETDSLQLAAASLDDVRGGWSLDLGGTDRAAERIAYVLYCDQEITFADGTVWHNPDFDSWRDTYSGRKTEVRVLENYYPYVQKIVY